MVMFVRWGGDRFQDAAYKLLDRDGSSLHRAVQTLMRDHVVAVSGEATALCFMANLLTHSLPFEVYTDAGVPVVKVGPRDPGAEPTDLRMTEMGRYVDEIFGESGDDDPPYRDGFPDDEGHPGGGPWDRRR